MNLDEYQREAFSYSRINWDDQGERHIANLGLIGELGSLASEIKKSIREGDAYTDAKKNLEEEFGDVLWYLAAIASRSGVRLSEVQSVDVGVSEHTIEPVYALGTACASLALIARDAESQPDSRERLVAALTDCMRALLVVMHVQRAEIDSVCRRNLAKGASYFGGDAQGPAPIMDAKFPEHERLPRQLKIQVLQVERGNGKLEVIMRSNGFNIGDRLTDNALIDDGYRFHDAFHFAYVAVLGWSPVTRSLLRAKRKSDGHVDEVQDGARAAVMEEAITHAMWDYARGNAMLESAKRIDHNILTLIQRMVRGLEVETIALHEWQKAFFVGFEAFRQLYANQGGWLLLDSDRRSLTYSRDGSG